MVSKADPDARVSPGHTAWRYARRCVFSGLGHLCHLHVHIRSLLPLASCPRLDPLRLLRDVLRIRLRGQSSRSQCSGRVRPVLHPRRNGSVGVVGNADIRSTKGAREEDDSVAVQLCRLHRLPAVRFYILQHGKRHDIRLQHPNVHLVDDVHLLLRLRMADRLLLVRGTVRSDQTGGLGSLENRHHAVPERVHHPLDRWLASDDAAQRGVHDASELRPSRLARLYIRIVAVSMVAHGRPSQSVQVLRRLCRWSVVSRRNAINSYAQTGGTDL